MQYCKDLLFDNRYLFKKFLGSGSFGEVWLAKDNETDLDVAVKIYISVDQQGLNDFKKEFQLSFNLNHTNLLHANYLGVCKEDNKPYLVMPFCPDGSVTKKAGKMDEKALWIFIRDVAAGLDYLHSQQPPIIHQDIKPDNILVLKNGNYVISDFGISKQLKNTLRKSAHLNSASGAVAYMGPERFSKQYQAVKASDIWSFGVTIYELVYGDLPFCGLGGSMQKQGADIPDLPEEFSKEIKILFTSCLAKETWNRPTAKQIMDYAAEYFRGATPKITWNYVNNEEQVQEGAKTPDILDVKPLSQTVISTIPQNTTIYNTPNNVNEKQKTIRDVQQQPKTVKNGIAWWWFIVVALVGLIAGIITKMVINI